MQGLRLHASPAMPRRHRLRPLLVAGLLGAGTVAAQPTSPSPESAACGEARIALEAALQAHRVGNAAATARLDAARRRTQAACLGGDAARAPAERVMPQAPYAVPAPGAPTMRTPPPAVALPAPPPIVNMVPPPSPRVLGPCDATGCWDNQGRRLNEGGGIYSAPGGGVCSVQGVFATCP